MGARKSESDQSLADSREDAVQALSARLLAFRKWLSEEANVKVHSAICVVNGEATDGTKNAPVLIFGPPSSTTNGSSAGALATKNDAASGRLGTVDGDGDQALYDRTMGCQVRAVREIKKDEVMMTMPRPAMITPDLVASSDAGRAVLGCCRSPSEDSQTGFWDAFENTTICETKFNAKVARNTGAQILVKILQERKRVETALKKRLEQQPEPSPFKLSEIKTISTRAPLLAFLIHQRFFGAERPLVSSMSEASKKEFLVAAENGGENALRRAKTISHPQGAPQTFGPYARTLPSSVSIPLCWKRNELALLAGCIPGFGILQEVATSTMQLASEFIALLEAGILERFPETFPPGLLTWERWVWAAAISNSRALPAAAYLNAGDQSADSFVPASALEFQSPADVWNELGVMIPLLDMLNHEVDSHQIAWEPCVPDVDEAATDEAHPPRAVVKRKIRKGSEVFICYGDRSNSYLMLQYGFALMNNAADEVRLGWSLAEGVGGVKPPHDSTAIVEDQADAVYESNDERAINLWWTEDRLELLEREVFQSAEKSFMDNLRAGKKMSAGAHADGTYDPILLSAAVIATLPSDRVQICLAQPGADKKLVITKKHQRVLMEYLCFSFTRKLEKLLQNLDSGLKGHFANVKLWTKASEGGLSYKETDGSFVGWQSFFDSLAYNTAIEVEKRYYAMGADSCVLTLYDGQLHALQASVDGVSDVEKFANGALKQLEDLGFDIGAGDIGGAEASTRADGSASSTSKPPENGSAEGSTNGHASGSSKSPRARKRNKKKSVLTVKPPALKLHVGNLSYSTTPSDLYDSFSKLYGEDNVLECHIPIERDTGRSRGFGFVAMPEEIANKVLQHGRKHEIDGRLLKIAKSNSAGSGNATRVSEPPVVVSSDRCASCGYRPKYCTCAAPSLPGGKTLASRGPDQDSVTHSRDSRDYNYHNSVSGRHRGDRYDDADWHRDYDWERRSQSYDMGRDEGRYHERSRRERGRGHSRDRSPGHSSRRWDYDEGRSARRERRSDHADWDERERKRSRSRSRSRSRDRGRKKKSKRRRSRSRGNSYDP